MLKNDILIKRLSDRFKKSEEEINDSIKYIFSKITSLILEGKVVYIYDIGFIYVDKSSNLIFRNADIAFDVSLENIVGKYYGQKTYYEAMFETMRHIIDNAGTIYIEDFGSFSYKDGYVHFESADNFSYLLEERNDRINKITSTALTRKLENRLNKSKAEVLSLIDELFKKITLSIIDNKVFYIYEIGYMFVNNNYQLTFRSADISFDESINNLAENENKKSLYETILEAVKYEVENGERIYIEYFGTFFYEDGRIKFEADEILLYVVDKRFNIKKIIENISSELDDIYSNKKIPEDGGKEKYKSMKKYTDSELLDINNFEKEFLTSGKPEKTRIKKAKNKKIGLNSILIAILIVIIAFVSILFLTYPNSNEGLSYDINDKNLSDIVNEYFDSINSKELLSYRLTSDMHYWDISKELYNDFTYWTLIYPYNGEYKADALIKKGTLIRYKNINKFSSRSVSNEMQRNKRIKDIKYFYNTLSKSFLLLYPDFVRAKKDTHALWTLKLSCYYDKEAFINNSDLIQGEVYSNILKENIGSLYSQFSKYNKLNKNIFSSFMAVIK